MSGIIIHKEQLTITASSGSGTVNTNQFIMGLMKQILVSPATASTIYDITVTSPEGLIISQTTSQTGDFADEMDIPVRGMHTVQIDNATVDELFTINLVIEERG